jgi:outer membrane protein, multidrug efflux system
MRRLAVFALVLLEACSMGPRYRRPPVSTPPEYRNSTGAAGASLGEEKWWTVFSDPELDKLIHTALQQNYDVRIAASRIVQAQAQVGVVRAAEYPSVSVSAGYLSEKFPGFGFNVFQLQGLFNWNINFWGLYRSATEAARATLLASEWNRRQVAATLVSNIASAYFQLRELDLELEIAHRTLASRQESLKLTRTLFNGGATSELDLRQAQQLVESAAAAVPDTERRIAQQEDLISTLLGENPHDIPRGLALTAQPLPATAPAGLPSSLLERRPDILQAEQQLIVANAVIAVARAQFFPSLPLTGTGGIESPSLGALLRGGASAWNFAAPLTQPVFTGGRLRSNLKLARAQQQEAVLTYQQTVQQAFREVSDALVAYQKGRQFREHQGLLVEAARGAADLSDKRYRGGAASYLEVLTNDTNLFAAELTLARAELSERLSLVQLYLALGGGW